MPAAGSETDKSTIAKIAIGSQSFFGINSSSNPNPRQITFRVNPITKTHAEADAFQQAADAGIQGGKGVLIVDRELSLCGLRFKRRGKFYGLAARYTRANNYYSWWK